MIEAKRDPRKQPAKGDVVEKIGRRWNSERLVQRVFGHEVQYRELNVDCDHDVVVIVFLKSWRKWAADAEVLKIGDEQVRAEVKQ